MANPLPGEPRYRIKTQVVWEIHDLKEDVIITRRRDAPEAFLAPGDTLYIHSTLSTNLDGTIITDHELPSEPGNLPDHWRGGPGPFSTEPDRMKSWRELPSQL